MIKTPTVISKKLVRQMKKDGNKFII